MEVGEKDDNEDDGNANKDAESTVVSGHVKGSHACFLV